MPIQIHKWFHLYKRVQRYLYLYAEWLQFHYEIKYLYKIGYDRRNTKTRMGAKHCSGMYIRGLEVMSVIDCQLDEKSLEKRT